MASALIGFGQQIYVVLRNQLLHDLSLPASLLGVVQAGGAAAGVAAGAVGLWLFPRASSTVLLRVGALTNAAGFAMQLAAVRPWQFVVGAAVAGFGIQTLSMASGPFLAQHVRAGERVKIYALQSVAIQTAPGALGAVLGGEIQRCVAQVGGEAVFGHRVALAVGTAAVALALLPLRRVAATTDAPRDRSPSTISVRAFRTVIMTDILVFFGAGLTVPFIQVYLRAEFGVPPHRVGWYFGGAMLAGTLANLITPSLSRLAGERRLFWLLQLATAAGFIGLATAATERGAAVSLVARAACAVSAAPLWTALLHARLRPDEGDRVAGWRMLSQSVAWTVANLLAGLEFSRGTGAMRDLLISAALAHAAAAWWGRRTLEFMESDRRR